MQAVLQHFYSRHRMTIEHVGHALLILSLLALMGALLQEYSGWGIRETIHLEPKKISIRSKADKAGKDDTLWQWKLPHGKFSPAQQTSAILLEDGQPAGYKARSKRQLLRGGGWYRLQDNYLRFSTLDGTNPKDNGHRYDLSMTMHVRDHVWWILAGMFALGCAMTRGRLWMPVHGAARNWKGIPAWMKIAAFFGLFVMVRMVQLYQSDYSDGVMSLRGIPSSDAGAWHEMARALAEGRGFDSGFSAQRPFYSLLLALFHQVFGSSVAVSLCVNSLLQAITATGVLILGGLLGSRFVGLMVASWMMFCPMQVALAQVVLTENMGAAFGVLGLLTFWRLLRTRSLLNAGLSGLIVGLGNLASGVFLLTVPLYPILIVLIGFWKHWPLRRIISCSAVFCVAVCALFLPWMIRQQVKFGAFTQSLNTAELLYGGAHPTEKRLTKKLHEEAAKDGILINSGGKRYNYFIKKYTALVKEDPVRYLKQIGEAFAAAAEYTPRTNPVWQWLTRVLIVLVALGQCVRRGWWLPAIPAAIALLKLYHFDDLSSIVSFAIAAAVVLVAASKRQRIGWLVVIVTAVSFLLITAMSGNVATDRFLTAGDWLVFLIWCGAWERLLVKSSQGLDWLWAKIPGRQRPEVLRMAARAGAFRSQSWRLSARASWAAVCLCLLSVAGTSLAYGWRSSHPVPDIVLEKQSCSELARHILQAHPDKRVHTLRQEALAMELVQLDEQMIFISRNEDLDSMTRPFEKRDHQRWVARALVLSTSPPKSLRLDLQLAGDLTQVPKDRPLLAVGVYSEGDPTKFGHEMNLFEVLCLCETVPADSPHTYKPDPDKVTWFRYHDDVKQAVRQIRPGPALP